MDGKGKLSANPFLFGFETASYWSLKYYGLIIRTYARCVDSNSRPVTYESVAFTLNHTISHMCH